MLQHPITQPREQSGWTLRALCAELTFWGVFSLFLSFSSRYIKLCIIKKEKKLPGRSSQVTWKGGRSCKHATLALFFPLLFVMCSVACFIPPTGCIPPPTQPHMEASHLTGPDRISQGSCRGLGVILSRHTAGAPR